MNLSISIITPARNEVKALRLPLDHLERLRWISTAEIIVAARVTPKRPKGARRFFKPGVLF
jgi:hypothetical protein